MRRMPIALILACVVVCALAATSWGEDVVVARIYDLQGRVEVSRDDGKSWSAASAGQDLNRGDTVRTGPLSRTSLLAADQSMVKIGAESALKLQDVFPSPKISMGLTVRKVLAEAGQSTYRMLKGQAWFRSWTTLLVETPTATVGVRGTEFGLVVEEKGEVVLSMLEGEARMFNQYGSIDVVAGEQGFCKPGSAPVKRVLVNPEDAVQWSLLYPTPVSFRDYHFVSQDPERLNALLGKAEGDLKARPSDLALWVQKGEILHDLGGWSEAQDAFRTAEGSEATLATARTGLGWVELQLGNLEGAANYFQRVIPPTEMSVLGSSLVLYRGGRGGDALVLLEAGMRTLGRTPRLLVQSAYLNLVFGRSKEAMGLLQEADRTEATAMGYGLLSNVYLAHNQKDRALGAAQEAVRINPYSSTAHVDQAWARQAHFDLPGAMEAARRAIELDPRNIRALITYGQLLFGSGYVDEAQETVNQVLSVSHEEALAHNLKGYILLARRKTDQAIESFREAIRLDSAQAFPHLGLGIAEMRKANVEEALQEMLAATLLEPRESLNYTYLGKALYQVKEFDQALNALQWAKALDPKDPSPYLYSGIIQTDLNRGAEAIREMERSVELNDNRAVYRSKLLLDEDRAVKNIDLARTYSKLGMDAMARNRALLSVKDDLNNSSAHLFMAGVLSREPDLSAATESELLKARLLEPANENTFNTFNNYTSFFERPTISGSPEVQGGNHGTQLYRGDFWGSWDNLAARDLFWYTATDGYKDHNFSRKWFNVFTLKYQLGQNHDFLVDHRRIQGKQGDLSTDLNAFAREDLDLTDTATIDRLTLGYRFRISPTSDLLFAFTRYHLKDVAEDGPLSEPVFPLAPGLFFQRYAERFNGQEEFLYGGATHILRLGSHRIQYGFDLLGGTIDQKDQAAFLIFSPFPPPFRRILRFDPVRDKIEPHYHSFYAQDTWRILPNLTLEAGLFYERTRDGGKVPVFTSQEFSLDRVSPRAGLIFNPVRDHTLRLGYSERLLTPFIVEAVLSPTDIAGFVIGRDSISPVVQKDLSFAWEAQWLPSVFMRIGAFKRQWDAQAEDLDAQGDSQGFLTKKRDFYGATVDWNIMFLEHFGFALGYSYTHSKDREFDQVLFGNPDRWWGDHKLRMGLFFWHPAGWRARFGATYITQKLHGFGIEDPSDFWFLDFSVQKELFDKRLEVGLGIQNLLDEKFNLITDVLATDARTPTRQFIFFARYNF
jgi:tetratricopeptide (TPR) repeat protein